MGCCSNKAVSNLIDIERVIQLGEKPHAYSQSVERKLCRGRTRSLIGPEYGVNSSVCNRKLETQMIYLAECSGLFKIGYSETPQERVNSFQIGNPFKVTLVSVWNGDRVQEQLLHEFFFHKRNTGEWFALDSDDIAAMETFLASGTEPILGTDLINFPIEIEGLNCTWCGRDMMLISSAEIECECGNTQPVARQPVRKARLIRRALRCHEN